MMQVDNLKPEDDFKINISIIKYLRTLMSRKGDLSNNLIAFLGAGCSADTYPTWKELIEDLAKQTLIRGTSIFSKNGFEKKIDEWQSWKDRWESSNVFWGKSFNKDPAYVIDAIESTLKEAKKSSNGQDDNNQASQLSASKGNIYEQEISEDLQQIIVDIFLPRRSLRGTNQEDFYTDAQKYIAQCAFKGYLTLNYDRGIIDALKKKNEFNRIETRNMYAIHSEHKSVSKWRDVINYNGKQNDSHKDPPVFYLHGYYDKRDSTILGLKTYRKLYSEQSSLALLETLLEQHRIVFMGYSFSDQWLDFNLREIIGSKYYSGGSAYKEENDFREDYYNLLASQLYKSGEVELESLVDNVSFHMPNHFVIKEISKDEVNYIADLRKMYFDKYDAQVIFYPLKIGESKVDSHEEFVNLLGYISGANKEGFLDDKSYYPPPKDISLVSMQPDNIDSEYLKHLANGIYWWYKHHKKINIDAYSLDNPNQIVIRTKNDDETDKIRPSFGDAINEANIKKEKINAKLDEDQVKLKLKSSISVIIPSLGALETNDNKPLDEEIIKSRLKEKIETSLGLFDVEKVNIQTGTYKDIINSMLEGSIDICYLGAFSNAKYSNELRKKKEKEKSKNKEEFIPILVRSSQLRNFYSSLLICGKGCEVTTLGGFVDKCKNGEVQEIFVGDTYSTSGFYIPIVEFYKLGFELRNQSLEVLQNNKIVKTTVTQKKSHRDIIKEVAESQGIVFGTVDSDIFLEMLRSKSIHQNVRVVWRFEYDVPPYMWLAHPDISKSKSINPDNKINYSRILDKENEHDELIEVGRTLMNSFNDDDLIPKTFGGEFSLQKEQEKEVYDQFLGLYGQVKKIKSIDDLFEK